jgi:hypothetical protein
MAENLGGGRNNFAIGLIVGAAVVIIGVLAYFYYERVVDKPVVKIDVPGFEGEITRDKGVDIEVGREKP